MTTVEQTAAALFHDLDDLVLRLKGLVLVRDIRWQRDSDAVELKMYDDEIRRVRDLLADFVKDDCGTQNPPRLEKARPLAGSALESSRP